MPDMSGKGSRVLRVCVVAALSVTAPWGWAQKPKEEERFTKYSIPAAPSALRMKEVVRMRVMHDEQSFFEKGTSGTYERRDIITRIEDRLSIGDRTTSNHAWGEKPVRMLPQVMTVKLIPHQETLYGKFSAKLDPYGKDSGISIQYEGMFEMEVIEGSYNDFQKGGTITVGMKKGDHDRFLATVTKAYQHRGFLTFCAEEFRELQMKQIEKLIAESPGALLPPGTDGAGQARFLEQVRNWRVQAIPTMRATPARYHFSGNTMISETKESGLEIRFVTTPSQGSPTVDPSADWTERYRVHKQSDFHAEDYDDTRVLDPREKLPGWYMPKWEQEKPAQ